MRLRISSFDQTVTKSMLQDLLEEFGEVNTIRILRDVNPGGKNSLCFVEMDRERDAEEALEELNGHIVNGHALCVEVSYDLLTSKSRHQKPINLEDEEEILGYEDKGKPKYLEDSEASSGFL